MALIPAQTFNNKSIPDTYFDIDTRVINLNRTSSGGAYPIRLTAQYSTGATTTIQYPSSNYNIIFASMTDFTVIREYNPSVPGHETHIDNATLITVNGQTLYYYTTIRATITFTLDPPVMNPNYPSDVYSAELAYLMVYGGYGGYSVTYDLTDCTGDEDNPTSILPNATTTTMRFTPDEGFELNSGSVWIDGEGISEGTPVVYNWDAETGTLVIGPVSTNVTIHITAYGDPYAEIDGEEDLPGAGSVSIPGLPGLSATSAGIIGLFAPSASQMQLLSGYMWTDFGGQGSTEVDVLKEIVEAIKRTISNPLDYVVGLNIIPSQGLSIGSSQEIRFGFSNSGVSMPRLTNQYFVVDCGTLAFDTVCNDTFLDYAPYSKFSIYLPYIGIKEVDANDFVGHTIGVVYHGDVVTGGITAYITKDGSVMYQYSGCCALNVPLSADGWGSTIAGAVQIASSVFAGASSGGSAGVVASAVNGASNVASNPSLLSPQVSHSGAVSGSAGCMGVQTPYVIREAVRFHSTAGFNTVTGYPSYYFRSLSNVHGFTTVYDVHLKNMTATDAEVNEIESLLKSGVIF